MSKFARDSYLTPHEEAVIKLAIKWQEIFSFGDGSYGKRNDRKEEKAKNDLLIAIEKVVRDRTFTLDTKEGL